MTNRPRREVLAIVVPFPCLAAALAAPGSGAPAPAQPPPARDDAAGYRTVVSDRRASGRLSAKAKVAARAIGFADRLDVRAAARDRPADGWTEALRGLAGVYARSYGGLGRFTAVSIRGSSGAQVQVLYDGIPVESSVAGITDLSMLSADLVSAATVHRGYVPVRYGGTAMGGLLHLTSDEGRAALTTARIGFGSFGAYELRARLRRPVARGHGTVHAAAALAGATGDFPYLDPGAPHDRSDDRTRRRRNNDYGRLTGQVKVVLRRRGRLLSIQPVVQVRERGVPGPAGAAWSGARSSERIGWLILGGRALLPRPGSLVRMRGSIRGSRRSFRDPEGTVGLGRDDEVQATVDAFGAASLRLSAWRGAFVEVAADHRIEHTRLEDRLAAPGDPTVGRRLRAGTGIEIEQSFDGGRVVVAAAERVEAFETRVAPGAATGPAPAAGGRDIRFAHTPRLGIRVRPHEAVRIRATVGRYVRPPTLVELFGDRGWAVGNPSLAFERGVNADGGLSLDLPVGPRGRLLAAAAGYVTRSWDLITWVQAGFVTRPQNVPGALAAGAEASLDALFARGVVDLHASYTYLWTQNLDPAPSSYGRPLPGRPAHHALAALRLADTVVRDGVALTPSLGYEAELVGATNLDPSGRYTLPARIFHAVSAGLAIDGWLHLSVAVRNLADRRTTTVRLPVGNLDEPIRVPVADVLGYPLPGRSVWLSAAIAWPRPRPEVR